MRKITDHIVEGDSVNHQLTIEVLDEPGSGGANHKYVIGGYSGRANKAREAGESSNRFPPDKTLILFQNGAIKESGINGLTHEALLAIIVDRLKAFEAGPYPSSGTAIALGFCMSALRELKGRTPERIARGVEGTHQK
jgi:hypothetical protein